MFKTKYINTKEQYIAEIEKCIRYAEEEGTSDAMYAVLCFEQDIKRIKNTNPARTRLVS